MKYILKAFENARSAPQGRQIYTPKIGQSRSGFSTLPGIFKCGVYILKAFENARSAPQGRQIYTPKNRAKPIRLFHSSGYFQVRGVYTYRE